MDGPAGMHEAGRVQTTDTETALRAHVRSHNACVLAASGVALVFSLVGWALLYGAIYWVAMISLAVANHDETMPAEFNWIFLGVAGVLLLAARVDQFFFPNERAVDERPPVEHFADILFFVPRFTMSCWQNLGALARLGDSEVADAAKLLDLLKTGERVSLQELPAMFPDDRARERMLTALLVMGLIDQRREKNMIWLHLGALAPDVFRSASGKLHAPEDPLAGVQQVKIRPRVRLLPVRGKEADE